jgi:hypothetical protein
MCILRPPIADKETLIVALENAEIENIQVFEDIIDGSQITSHIKNDFSGNYRYTHSVIVITKRQSKVEEYDL